MQSDAGRMKRRPILTRALSEPASDGGRDTPSRRITQFGHDSGGAKHDHQIDQSSLCTELDNINAVLGSAANASVELKNVPIPGDRFGSAEEGS